MGDYEEFQEIFPAKGGEKATELKESFEQLKNITVTANNVGTQENFLSNKLAAVDLQIDNLFNQFMVQRDEFDNAIKKFYEKNSTDSDYVPKAWFEPMYAGNKIMHSLVAWLAFKAQFSLVGYKKFVPVAKDLIDSHVAQKASEQNLKVINTVINEAKDLMKEQYVQREEMLKTQLQMLIQQHQLDRKEATNAIIQIQKQQQAYLLDVLRTLFDDGIIDKNTYTSIRDESLSKKPETIQQPIHNTMEYNNITTQLTGQEQPIKRNVFEEKEDMPDIESNTDDDLEVDEDKKAIKQKQKDEIDDFAREMGL